MSTLQKEKVKARMMQNAAKLWGVKDGEIEVAFDPLVAMLIEGCVNEIEKINNEIRNTDARVIKHLAQLITPDIMTGFRPPHAIMQARPAEDVSIIKPDLQFYYTKKTQSEQNPKLESSTDIYFSPAASFKLVNCQIKYTVFHDSIFENSNAYQKKQLTESENLKQLERGSIWLGLSPETNVEELNGLSFYFDLKNNPTKSGFINLLPYSKWSVNNVQLNTKMGLSVVQNRAGGDVFSKSNADARYTSDVLSAYDHHFITVADITGEALHYPEHFESVFAKKDLQKLESKCIWLKVEFNPSADQMLPDLVCGINCFPVINKKLNEFTFRLSQNLNIVPLKSAGYFLSMRSVCAQDGAEYTNLRVATGRRGTL
jgi:hypothetical protein